MSRFSVLHPRFVRTSLGLIALTTCLACFGGDCDNDKDDDYNYGPVPVITSVVPCAALPGETVTIQGANLLGVTVVTIGGEAATLISKTGTTIQARISDNATNATNSVFVGALGGSAYGSLKVLTNTAVPEVEPNDDVNGADATNTLSERVMTGSLSSPVDRDHFRVDCLDPARTYKLKVTPATISPVYVNGGAVALDANGEATIPSGLAIRLIGLTGHTGAYTVTLTPN